MTYDERIQLIMVGESGVGKTSLIRRYTNNIFNTNHLETIGIEFFNKEERINDQIIQIKFWDTAGQEIFHSLTKNFYRKADGIIIVYDITNKESFERIQDWVKSVYDNTDTYKEIQMIIVGNKIDLEERREVSKEEGLKIGKYFEIDFFEASAKNAEGVRNFMIKIIEDILNNKVNNRNSINIKNYKNGNDDEDNERNCFC
jgi:small GTP-binding protein